VLSGEQEPPPPVNWRTSAGGIRSRAQYLSIVATQGFAAICDLEAPLEWDRYERYSAGSSDTLPGGARSQFMSVYEQRWRLCTSLQIRKKRQIRVFGKLRVKFGKLIS